MILLFPSSHKSHQPQRRRPSSLVHKWKMEQLRHQVIQTVTSTCPSNYLCRKSKNFNFIKTIHFPCTSDDQNHYKIDILLQQSPPQNSLAIQQVWTGPRRRPTKKCRRIQHQLLFVQSKVNGYLWHRKQFFSQFPVQSHFAKIRNNQLPSTNYEPQTVSHK